MGCSPWGHKEPDTTEQLKEKGVTTGPPLDPLSPYKPFQKRLDPTTSLGSTCPHCAPTLP